MKKYTKLWKNLFSKYANTGFTTKVVRDFDQMGEKAQMINLPEMTKLLKDQGMLPAYISKDDLGALFRIINIKSGNKADTTTLDYFGYLSLIPQVSFFSFSKPPKDLSCLPLVESLHTLI